MIIETEFMPANTLEADVMERVDAETTTAQRVGGVVGVRVPDRFRRLDDGPQIRSELRISDDLEYAVWSPSRFPARGWITGGLVDIARAAEAVSVPRTAVGECVNDMDDAVTGIANILGGGGARSRRKIARLLSQRENEQTWKMAGLILSNAFVFHSHIAGGREIRSLPEISALQTIPTDELVGEWDRILEINYYAVFDVARNVIASVDDATAQEIISILYRTTGKINARGLATSTDVYGSLIQRMVNDRFTLASFYTLPESAALLAGLAVPAGGDPVYATADGMTEMRVGDFACGTGTLLTTAYKIMAANYEARTGCSMEDLHADMMRRAIVGFDVLPSAVHLTVSALAEMYPHTLFRETTIGQRDFGVVDGNVRLGSLDLIEAQRTFDERGAVVHGGAAGPLSDAETFHGRFSLILMNPPFTTNTKSNADQHSMFASFETTKDDQKSMAAKEKSIFKGTCANGNAGGATNFLAIADRLLRPGGTLGMVLPSTIAWGSSWSACRKLIAESYEDVCVVSIAGDDMSFSFDTGMGEVLLVARKGGGGDGAAEPHSGGNGDGRRGLFVTLHERPPSILHAIELTKSVKRAGGVAKKIDGNGHGWTPVEIGPTIAGSMLDCPLDSEWWWHAGVRDPNLSIFAYRLATTGRFIPPGQVRGGNISMTAPYNAFWLSERSISDNQKTGTRAPFMIYPIDKTVTYPVLQNNNNETQRSIVVEPDAMAVPKSNANEERIELVAGTATHLHANRTCRYTSQSVLFPYTERPTLGSGAFPSFQASKPQAKALAAWGNSSLGIICFWAHAGKQQSGRGKATRTSMAGMPVLDVWNMDADALKKIGNVFDRRGRDKLRPMNMCYDDVNRMRIDDELLAALGINRGLRACMDDIRRRFCREPVVRCGRVDDALDAAGPLA